MHLPDVSIAIRAYRRTWLSDAIASVLRQTYTDLELVVYDDAGNLRDVVAGFDDARIRYYRAERRLGPGGRFAAAVAQCRGRYVGILDDDDWYEPAFVSTLRGALDEHPDAGLAWCRVVWDVEGERRVQRTRPLPDDNVKLVRALLGRSIGVQTSSMLIRRAVLDAVDRSHAVPDNAAPDFFYAVQVGLSGARLLPVAAPLVVCRWHGAQLSRSPVAGSEIAFETFRALELSDPELGACRDRLLARSFLSRALQRLRSGDSPGARANIREAALTSPSSVRVERWLIQIAAALGPLGHWMAGVYQLVKRSRQRPP